jgi:hypothetical protein
VTFKMKIQQALITLFATAATAAPSLTKKESGSGSGIIARQYSYNDTGVV